MRQSLIFIFTIFFLASSLARDNRDQTNKELSEVDRLYYTCKIWGFLKYYHPKVGKGVYDWDEQLQTILKNSGQIQTHEGFSEAMARWIYYLGPRERCGSCNDAPEGELFLENFDLSWTQSNEFSEELRKSLLDIERNRFQGDHHYIGKGKVNQFEPKNESADDMFDRKDKYQRLLPLFRYWNFIEYFFPYKYQTDQPWDEVLKEMIPKFIQAEEELDFHLAMKELIVKIDDSHAGFYTPILDKMPYYNYLPVRLELIEGRAIVTEILDKDQAEKDDLQVGDIFLEANSRPIMELHNANKKYISASNEAVKNRSMSYNLFMGIKDSVLLKVDRGGEIGTKYQRLYKFSDLEFEKKSGDKWKIMGDSIRLEVLQYDSINQDTVTYDSISYVEVGYVNMGQLYRGDVKAMMEELMDKKAIIFDIRSYPRGTYRDIAKFLNSTDTVFAKFTRPDYTYPGKFIWQGESKCGEKNEAPYLGKIILLVNEQTQSHAEFTCMCLQTAPNVITIGSQTSGADGNVSKFSIMKNYYTAISGIGVFYPDGRETQRIGIVPDINLRPTINGVREGKDEVLEKAMQIALED